MIQKDKLIREFQLQATVAEYANLSMGQRISLESQRVLLKVRTNEKPTIRLLGFLDDIFQIINIQDEIEELQYEIPAARLDAFHRTKKTHLEAYSGEVLYGNIYHLRTVHEGIINLGKTFEEEEGKFKEMKEAYHLRKVNVENAEEEELQEHVEEILVKSMVMTHRELKKGTTINEEFRKSITLQEEVHLQSQLQNKLTIMLE